MHKMIYSFFILTGSLHALDPDPASLDTHASPCVQGQMTIDPKMRAQDYVQAFDALRKEKTSGKVFVQISGMAPVTNVIEMSVIGNGTLVLFKYNTSQGIKFQVVEVEKIISIGHS